MPFIKLPKEVIKHLKRVRARMRPQVGSMRALAEAKARVPKIESPKSNRKPMLDVPPPKQIRPRKYR